MSKQHVFYILSCLAIAGCGFDDSPLDSDHSSGLSEVEVAVLSALSCRFNPVDDETPPDAEIDDNTAAYIEALLEVYNRFPSFACVSCLYAESLMNFSPWKLWCLESGVPQPHAQKAKIVLDKALQRAPHHPGLNHFLVHLMEMSPTPQAALPSCDVLRFHFPDAGEGNTLHTFATYHHNRSCPVLLRRG